MEVYDNANHLAQSIKNSKEYKEYKQIICQLNKNKI